MTTTRRQTRRKRRASKRVEGVRKGAQAFGSKAVRRVVWSMLFFALLSSLAGVVVMIIAGKPAYAALFLPSTVLAGVALWKREGG